MSDAAVLFVKPRAIKSADKRALRDAGIIVVEVENPADIKFTRAETELPCGDLLAIAAGAIAKFQYARESFGRAVAEALMARRPKEPPHD